MILSKNVNNKKCAPKLLFFNEKKLRKILMIFDIKNVGTFWQLAINPILKIQSFPLVKLIFRQKSFVSPVWKLHNPYCHNALLSRQGKWQKKLIGIYPLLSFVFQNKSWELNIQFIFLIDRIWSNAFKVTR